MSTFEERYRADADPWRYETSPYERHKYARTLAACGPGPGLRALELGGSIGVFTALLAPRCITLVTIDLAPTAVAAARKRIDGIRHVDAREGTIPADLPDGPFDLVVASEILYYLEPAVLHETLDALRERLALHARLVSVHGQTDGPERPLTAQQVRNVLWETSWLRSVSAEHTEPYLLDVLEAR